MRRREFIAALGGAVTLPIEPLLAAAQQPGPMRRIGVLMTLTKDNAEGQARLSSLRQGLAALGWIDGRNIRIDARWPGDDVERLRTDARELIASKPDVIVSGGSRALTVLQAQTQSIPIVFVAAAGSAEHGIVTNIARPPANLTGFTTFDTFALAGKLMGALKEMAPSIVRIILIMYRGHPSVGGYSQQLAKDAPSLGIAPSTAQPGSADELERAIVAFAREPNGGLLFPADQFNIQHRDQIIALAKQHRLPAIYAYRSHVEAGGLMSYGIDFSALYRPAASYVDRILKGEKPADLPVQSPTKYELTINLKTANALGLAMPPALIARADAVIE